MFQYTHVINEYNDHCTKHTLHGYSNKPIDLGTIVAMIASFTQVGGLYTSSMGWRGPANGGRGARSDSGALSGKP